MPRKIAGAVTTIADVRYAHICGLYPLPAADITITTGGYDSGHKAGNIAPVSQKMVGGCVIPITQKILAAPAAIFPVFGLTVIFSGEGVFGN